MRTLAFIFTLLILINCKAQEMTFLSTVPFQSYSGGSSYGISGTKVYKKNGNGSIDWVRNFSERINLTSPDPNVLTGIALDNDRLFIQCVQGGTANLKYSCIVLDTSGNTLHVRTSNVATIIIQAKGCIRATTGGAWMIFNTHGGIGNNRLFVKVDSTGAQQFSYHMPSIRISTYNVPVDYEILADSSYIFLFDISTNATPQTVGTGVVRISKYGVIQWTKIFYDSGTGYVVSTPRRSVVDSTGYIYIIGVFSKSSGSIDDEGIFALKLDQSGSLVLQKEWLRSSVPSVWGMGWDIKIANDSLLFQFSQYASPQTFGEIKMDFFFNPLCMDPPYPPGFNQSSTPQQYESLSLYAAPTTYTPLIDSFSYNQGSQQFTDYCILLSDLEIDSKSIEEVKIYPNPFNSGINIQFETDRIRMINIYDLLGRKIKSQTFRNKNAFLSSSNLPSGMLLLKILEGERVTFSRRINHITN